MCADHVLAEHDAARAPTQAPPSPTVRTPSPVVPAPVVGPVVGAFDDPAERAADRRADDALAHLERFVDPAAAVPRGEGAADRSRVARRAPSPLVRARVGAAGGALDSRTSARIDALRPWGSPLPDVTRRRMELGFGAPLGHVRVHEGPEPARLNGELSARAFTSGNDIFLGSGISPSHPAAERVLAHEIAHVLDPGRGAAAGNAHAQPVRREPEKLEREVDGAGHTDSEYPKIRLRKDGALYEVCNEGPAKGTVLWWDVDSAKWLRTHPPRNDGPRAPDSSKPVNLSELKYVDAVDGVRVVVRTEYDAGDIGRGLAFVTAPTTLRTTGLITCIAWLLHNDDDDAAYLTHIVLGHPGGYVDVGVRERVQSIVAKFTRMSGSPPTRLTMRATDDSAYQKASWKTWPWMQALVPPGVALTGGEIAIGSSEFTHVVKPSRRAGVRVNWRDDPITVQKKRRAESPDGAFPPRRSGGPGLGSGHDGRRDDESWRPGGRSGGGYGRPRTSRADESRDWRVRESSTPWSGGTRGGGRGQSSTSRADESRDWRVRDSEGRRTDGSRRGGGSAQNPRSRADESLSWRSGRGGARDEGDGVRSTERREDDEA